MGWWWMLLACSAWMAAVGWYVGLVHYPTFRWIRDEDWPVFHQMHVQRTGWCVGLPMVGQALATVGTSLGPFSWWVVATWACFLMSFGWTAVVSGPLHQKMEGPHRKEVIDRLVRTNPPRAVAWTLQVIVCLFAIPIS